MRSFILRSSLFITTFILFGMTVKSLLPYYWGNSWLVHKFDQEHADIIGAKHIFLGSSRTYRHIIPSVFDSIMHQHGVQGQSYNLGSPAVFPPQSYYILEKSIENGFISKGSIVFFELSESREIPSDQIGSARASYWSNTKDLLHVLQFAFSCAPDSMMLRYIKSHMSVYLQNLFSVAQFRGIFNPTNIPAIDENTINSKGFVSLDREMELSSNRSIRDDLTNRQGELIKDTLKLLTQRDINSSIRNNQSHGVCVIEYERLIQLHQKCKKQGIRLIYFTPAGFMTPGLFSLFQQLPTDMKIDMNDPTLYPQWYQFRYRFDRGHLNEAGAFLYSQFIALEYVDFLKMHKLNDAFDFRNCPPLGPTHGRISQSTN